MNIRAPEVIHQTIDGEVIAINLETGNYYSLRGSGADIWNLIASTGALEDVVQELGRIYDGEPATIAAATSTFVEQLTGEGLLAGDQASPLLLEEFSMTDVVDGSRKPFEPPMLERFDDMQDLIMLDPIHEIDAAEGWPHRKEDA